MGGNGQRLAKLEQAWAATLEPHATVNERDRAKGHYGQLARQLAPLLIEETKTAIQRAEIAERNYAALLQANQRLIEERDRMIANSIETQRNIERLKDTIARLQNAQGRTYSNGR